MKANELKVTDLMVGDWVCVISAEPNTYRRPFYQIITVEKMMMIRNRRMVVEPIPLTPEILEKNGLANDPYGCHFKEDEYMTLEISVEEDGIYWTINFNEYGILKLKYVHELQHALRLCKIDKEIVV